MKKPVFIINGHPGSGKDTFVELVSKHIKVKNYSTIGRVKVAALSLGWDGEKDERGRLFLHELKMLSVKFYDDPFKSAMDAVKEFQEESDELVMFIHSRELNEIARFKAEGFEAILVKGRGAPMDNPADRDTSHTDYDLTILNNGYIGDYELVASSFASMIMKGERANV